MQKRKYNYSIPKNKIFLQKKSYSSRKNNILRISTSGIYKYLVSLVILVSILVSCSTKKNTFTRRVYHNLTSHYNAFWNGRESFRQGIRQLADLNKDDYNKVLAVFEYGTEADAQSVYPQMDRAIEKSSKVIQNHSIYIKRKEHVRWIDDSYLLMGKAQLYKQEYRLAKRTFEFIVQRFKREPIKYEAMVWIARANNAMGKFDEAQSVLDQVENKSSRIDKRTKRELAMVYADFYIRQGNYGPAIDYLQRAISYNHKKSVKNRLRFITAQIYQRQGYLQRASKYYAIVIKKNPPYEMEFNAKINMAKCFDAGSENSKEIRKTLNKMIRDEKNKEFLDQVYFALAEIAVKEKKKQEAMDYLRLSVSHSVNNDYQKTASSLAAADLFFKEPKYKLAQAYYDTAVQALPTDYPNYGDISRKTQTLTELVQNILIVERQDSLQRLGQMSEKERNKIIDAIIAEIRKEEEKQRQEEMNRQQNLNFLTRNNRENNMSSSSSGNWYFYDPKQISLGYSEFINKWGKRKLEDNWRLSNKQMVSFEFEEEEGDSLVSDSLKEKQGNPKTREYYLTEIPLTEDDIDASNEKIAEALYMQGMIYKEKLLDEEKSAEAYEKLLERFPKNEYLPEVYYHLYVLYQEEDNLTMADKYKNLILTDYTESDYAKLILDPNYKLQLIEKLDEAKKFYHTTFLKYKKQDYLGTIRDCDTAINKFDDKKLQAKFTFLRALSLGKVQNKEAMGLALNKLILKYPESEVIPFAKDILDVMKTEGDTIATLEDPEDKKGLIIEESIYNEDAGSKHLYVLLINPKEVNVNAMKIKISDFNRKYFKLDDLNINNIVFDSKFQIITVSSFGEKEKALNYFNTIKDNKYIFANTNSVFYQFVITSLNYTTFYKDKNIDNYLAFFNQKYVE